MKKYLFLALVLVFAGVLPTVHAAQAETNAPTADSVYYFEQVYDEAAGVLVVGGLGECPATDYDTGGDIFRLYLSQGIIDNMLNTLNAGGSVTMQYGIMPVGFSLNAGVGLGIARIQFDAAYVIGGGDHYATHGASYTVPPDPPQEEIFTTDLTAAQVAALHPGDALIMRGAYFVWASSVECNTFHQAGFYIFPHLLPTYALILDVP